MGHARAGEDRASQREQLEKLQTCQHLPRNTTWLDIRESCLTEEGKKMERKLGLILIMWEAIATCAAKLKMSERPHMEACHEMHRQLYKSSSDDMRLTRLT